MADRQAAHLQRLLDEQVKAALVEQVAGHGPAFSAVNELRWLTDVPHDVRQRHPVNIESLGNNGSFVAVCPSLEYCVLWVRATNRRYRAEFEQFLTRVYPQVGVIPPGYHVDHLFNRKRAVALGLAYIRMALVPAGINISHGGGYERARTGMALGTPGRPRKLENVIMMKLLGFRSPPLSGVVTDEMQAFAARFAAELNVTPAQILSEITNLVRHAAEG